ncbi:putative membrane protein SpoIIM required for sporulation [Pseudoduganella lurida]|uniref:Putative membrane protein SpoIIM required for sporulation n=1 Tax=Pseudoduganella lurida TaxID=1036180 RepID=A0A562QVU9_9BURK|nr:stage II sporulation protein M [Pseudoduganella lurida]TWI60915.1 putative membrane protein SpoIIM required for sporulation [Pseudoduganella lurida]
MKQVRFEAEHGALWDSIGAIVDGTDGSRRTELPALYRRLCQTLALAEQRGYSPTLVAWLRQLVHRCHRLLYGSAAERPGTLLGWLRVDLPRRVRAEWRLLLLVLLAFWGTGLLVGLLVWDEPARAFLFRAPAQLDRMERMYQPGPMRLGRGDEGDVLMFGHYVWNNISIGFRTFAGGFFGGVPALASLVYNGIELGVVGAWLTMNDATRIPFWSFVITHASVEITGLLLSALAGIRLGLALIAPGRLSRRDALQAMASHMFPVVAGAALFTLLAAFIEAFFSAHAAIPAGVKFGVGAACWLAVLLYFAFAGRKGG